MNLAHVVVDPNRSVQVPKGHCALAVMAKAPRAGQVKTRLVPPLTPEEAADLNACFLRDTAAAIGATAAERETRGLVVYTPVGDEAAYAELLPAQFQLIPQRGEALEERLIFAMQDIFRLGFDSVCLINSDSPTVPPQSLLEAVTALSQPENSVVLGPTDDGGYYLIGLKTVQSALFKDISWSTGRVLEQTIERARQSNMKIHLLPPWYDVDDHVSLRRLCAEFFDPNGSTTAGYAAPATRAYLEALLKREGRERIWPNEAKS